MNDMPSISSVSNAVRAADGSTLSDRIRPLLPRFEAAAARTEAERRVPEESIKALQAAGMFRIYVPRAYGGTEESIIEVCKCIRLIARVCPSTAWVVAVLATHPFITTLYSKKMQDEFWADGPDTLCSTSGFPAGKGRIVDGGVVVSGRYPFSSGCLHSSWAMVGVSVPDVTKPNPERTRMPYFCIVPRKDFDIEDDWTTMGLAGTASRTLIFKDVFIPSYRMEISAAMTGRWTRGEGIHKGWLWNAGYGATIGTALTPVSLGIADAMLELMTKRIKGKTIPTTRIPLNSIPNAMRLAESRHELRAISLLWDDYLAQVEGRARAGLLPTENESAEGSIGVYVQEVCTRMVDRLFAVSGGSAIRWDNPIQRFFRDAHAARAHVAAEYDASAQIYARHILELPAGPRFG